MIKNIIFDVDGTLIDTKLSDMMSLKETLKETLGRDFEESELSFSLGIPGKETLSRLNIKDIEGTLKMWDEKAKSHSGHNAIFDEIQSLLERLIQKRHRLFVVTSRRRTECSSDPLFQNLASCFTHIICADDTSQHKPFPDPLFACIEKARIKKEESIYIGDTVYDSQCAKDAGVQFALALWGAQQPENVDAEYRLKTPLSLLDLL